MVELYYFKAIFYPLTGALICKQKIFVIVFPFVLSAIIVNMAINKLD